MDSDSESLSSSTKGMAEPGSGGGGVDEDDDEDDDERREGASTPTTPFETADKAADEEEFDFEETSLSSLVRSTSALIFFRPFSAGNDLSFIVVVVDDFTSTPLLLSL